jgi:hypothetical protein
MRNSGWDIDFADGKAGEDSVAHILGMSKVEVKTDRRWIETGNIYVEVLCYYQNSQSWKPSGLSVTEAEHWTYNLEGTLITTTPEVLKYACKKYGKQISCDIEPNPSKGYLITVGNIMRATADIKRLRDSAE